VNYIKGTDRDQVILFPEAVDDYIDENNTVKFVDVFVDSLDLVKLGFKHSELQATGRPPYNPADMLKLYIYGYLNRIRSSRRLEKEAGRNLELIWLLKQLAPDFKTIANFRKDNAKALRSVFREFTLLCKNLDLFGAELIAVDGSKFRAQNAKKKSFNKDKLSRTIRDIDKKISDYMDDLDENDESESQIKKPSAKELQEKIDGLKNRRTEYKRILADLEASGNTGVSLTDPDSRLMMSNQKVEVCYNVQMSVDSKYKLIVDFEMSDSPADQGQLSNMAKRAKEILDADNLEVLADKGYYDPKDIKDCMDSGITPTVPRPRTNRRKAGGLFAKAEFTYDSLQDCHICPAGQNLTLQTHARAYGKNMRRYQTDACKDCRLKQQCTKASRRTIERWEHEHLLEEMQVRVEADKEKYRLRQHLSEHPFGTLKRGFDQGYLLLKRFQKVRGEFSLSALAYNIKRAIKIVGVQGLIEAARRPGRILPLNFASLSN